MTTIFFKNTYFLEHWYESLTIKISLLYFLFMWISDDEKKEQNIGEFCLRIKVLTQETIWKQELRNEWHHFWIKKIDMGKAS